MAGGPVAGAAAFLEEGMEETRTMTRLGVTGSLAETRAWSPNVAFTAARRPLLPLDHHQESTVDV